MLFDLSVYSTAVETERNKSDYLKATWEDNIKLDHNRGVETWPDSADSGLGTSRILTVKETIRAT